MGMYATIAAPELPWEGVGEAEVVRFDDVEAACIWLTTNAVAGVVMDVRDLSLQLGEAIGRLRAAAKRVPILVLIDPLDTAHALEAIELDVAWLDPAMLTPSRGGELLSRMFEKYARVRAEWPEHSAHHEQLVDAEKFAAVGMLAAEIAHEINNPATFVITNLSIMMEYVDTIGQFHDAARGAATRGELDRPCFDELVEEYEVAFLAEDIQRMLTRSLAGLERIHQIVQDLRYFAYRGKGTGARVNLPRLVETTANLVRHEIRFRATLRMEIDDLPAITTDANRLAQVLLNVLVNAAQAVEAGSPDENEIVVRGFAEGPEVVITVRDTGSGIAEDVRGRIFEPFFTTKPPGMGTGLGLAISRDIMRAIGGDLSVLSTSDQGTVFEIRLPAQQAE